MLRAVGARTTTELQSHRVRYRTSEVFARRDKCACSDATPTALARRRRAKMSAATSPRPRSASREPIDVFASHERAARVASIDSAARGVTEERATG